MLKLSIFLTYCNKFRQMKLLNWQLKEFDYNCIFYLYKYLNQNTRNIINITKYDRDDIFIHES